MPLSQSTLSYDFRVLYGEDVEILTVNTISIEVDFIDRIVKLSIVDTADNLSAIALRDYLSSPNALVWDIMKGGDRLSYSFTYFYRIDANHACGKTRLFLGR